MPDEPSNSADSSSIPGPFSSGAISSSPDPPPDGVSFADTDSFGVFPAGSRESVETGATVTVVEVDGANVDVVAAGVDAATVVVVVATGVPEVADEAEPVPTAFVAVTDTEYDVPFVKPVITHDVDVDGDGVHAEPDEVDEVDAVYDVIALEPESAGAVHDTVNCVSPATNDTDVGAPGTVTGVPDTELDARPVP